jgi:hypothetical protein
MPDGRTYVVNTYVLRWRGDHVEIECQPDKPIDLAQIPPGMRRALS